MGFLRTLVLEQRFQFTPLREGRPQGRAPGPREHYFNSRPCGRGDVLLVHTEQIQIVFQFTPLREGRRISLA